MRRQLIVATALACCVAGWAALAGAASDKDAVMRIKSAAKRSSRGAPAPTDLLAQRLGGNYRGPVRTAAGGAGPKLKVVSDGRRGVVAVSPDGSEGSRVLAPARAGEAPRDLAVRYIAENRNLFRLDKNSLLCLMKLLEPKRLLSDSGLM